MAVVLRSAFGFREAYRPVKSSRASPWGKSEVMDGIMRRHGLVFLLQVCSVRLGLECGGTGRGDGMILIAGATADANRTYYLAIQLQRDAAGKNHDSAVV
jgi:hypothetical protein